MRRWASLAFLPLSLALAQTPSAPFAIVRPESLPEAVQGKAFSQFFAVNRGGFVTWQIAGKLPPGLSLSSNGELRGVPALGADLQVTVTATDSGGQVAQREYGLHVSGLGLEWASRPQLEGAALTGTIETTNYSHSAVDLTVIVYAINDVNKATALGYQHLTLQPGAQLQVPFGAQTQLPAGRYYVHVDAVGGPSRQSIFRSQLETGREFVVAPPAP